MVEPTGVFCIQLYALLSHYLFSSPFLYLDLYLLGDDASISNKIDVGDISCTNQALQLFFTDCSKALLLSQISFATCASCLPCCLVCSFQPGGHLLGKGWSLGSFVCDVFVFLSLSCMVSWVRCGIQLCRLLTPALFLTLISDLVWAAFADILS